MKFLENICQIDKNRQMHKHEMSEVTQKTVPLSNCPACVVKRAQWNTLKPDKNRQKMPK